LGLAFARHVAEAMGGGITVTSPPDTEVASKRLTGTGFTLSVHPRGGARSSDRPFGGAREGSDRPATEPRTTSEASSGRRLDADTVRGRDKPSKKGRV
jgi:hypothetical protein